MSRIRTIKPDAFRSETLCEISLSAERTFFGLITEVDDDGRIKERPAVLNGALWSLRHEHTVQHMTEDIEELIIAELMCRYEFDGVKYLHLRSFKRHQRINRPTASKLPPCETCTVAEGGARPNPEPAQLTLAGTDGSPMPLPGAQPPVSTNQRL